MIIDDSTWRHHFMKHICPLEGHKLIAVPSVVGKLQDKGKLNISSWSRDVMTVIPVMKLSAPET